MITHIETISPRLLTTKLEDIIKTTKLAYVNEFTEASLKDFKIAFNAAIKSGQDVIPVVIDSYGGAVDALTGMIDEIKSCPIPVATIATGKAMSCGSFLLAAGTPGRRYISPSARVMIHQVSAGTWGKKEEMRADVNETERISNMIWEYMDRWCNKPTGYFIAQMKERSNADWFLDPHDAFRHGLVDHIGLPCLKTIVEVKTELV